MSLLDDLVNNYLHQDLVVIFTQVGIEVFLNDKKLIKEGLCIPMIGHDHHIHFEINPPIKT